MWYESKVFTGTKHGRTIGFPTLNLDPSVLLNGQKEGVYAALVKHSGTMYKGALYFGPRKTVGEAHTVLEIYVFDFSKEIYGQTVEFQMLDYIREAQIFSSLDKLKSQIEQDIKAIELCLNK